MFLSAGFNEVEVSGLGFRINVQGFAWHVGIEFEKKLNADFTAVGTVLRCL